MFNIYILLDVKANLLINSMPPVNSRIFSIHIDWTYKCILLNDINNICRHLSLCSGLYSA